jgi:hypothetical protein
VVDGVGDMVKGAPADDSRTLNLEPEPEPEPEPELELEPRTENQEA